MIDPVKPLRVLLPEGSSTSAREALTILGGSGVGKSVMLKLLIGLLKPDAGSIRFDGQELVSLSEAQLLPVRRRISR